MIDIFFDFYVSSVFIDFMLLGSIKFFVWELCILYCIFILLYVRDMFWVVDKCDWGWFLFMILGVYVLDVRMYL